MAQQYPLDNNFTYHPPFGDQAQRYTELREDAGSFAALILQKCPESRERSLALTKLEESVMWANASIARNEKAPEEPGDVGLARLAQRYEKEHLVADLAAVVDEKERERRVALGLEDSTQPAKTAKELNEAVDGLINLVGKGNAKDFIDAGLEPQPAVLPEPGAGFIDPGIEGEPPPSHPFPGFAR